jgi:Tfp pilus assembly protein FimT
MKNDAMQIALSGISARIEISPRGRESWGGKNGESKGIGMGLLRERNSMSSKNSKGFSMLELLVVIGIGFTMAAVSVMALLPLFLKSHVDSGYDTTLAVLRNTRNLAIAQTHEYIITFTPTVGTTPATITVQYQPAAAAGVIPPPQLVNTYTLPPDVNFAVKTGFPSNTPDAFGSGVTAIDFGYGPNQTSGQPTVVFGPDGGAYDQNGDYNGGVVYLVRSADTTMYNSRAITVFGATGRVRGWRLDSVSGTATWEQQ